MGIITEGSGEKKTTPQQEPQDGFAMPARVQPSYDSKPEEKPKSDIVITIIVVLIIINFVLLILDYFNIVNFALLAKSIGLKFR